MPVSGVTVQRGPTGDGPAVLPSGHHRIRRRARGRCPVLRDTKVDILIYRGRFEQADKARPGRHRCRLRVRELPVFIASDPGGLTSSARLVCRSSATISRAKVGATITHRVLVRPFEDRGVRLDRTYQLNVGGDMTS